MNEEEIVGYESTEITALSSVVQLDNSRFVDTNPDIVKYMLLCQCDFFDKIVHIIYEK